MSLTVSRRSGWHTPVADDHPAAPLLSAKAVRRHCLPLMERLEAGDSPVFAWQPQRLTETAAFVAATIRQRYPDLKVPYHSRWRHFEAGGVDRWRGLLNGTAANLDPLLQARIAVDLVIPSVLLDAGAGPDWHYLDRTSGRTLTRSEGLAVASLDLLASGLLSARPDQPLRCDAAALTHLKADQLARSFQVAPDNPLVGLEGRARLLNRLGEVMAATPAVFGSPARLGNLVDYLLTLVPDGILGADRVLEVLLKALGPVWPGRIDLEGVSLGDTWHHEAAPGGLVPFHKLTQWLTYSLLEPLEWAGFTLTGLDELTGLPEYRNGGLLLDTGLLVPRQPDLPARPLTVDDPVVVEWRAVTVIVLDRLAGAVREQLNLSEADFPLARVLEGGTWAAGRRIAARKRPGGPPPLTLISDGTVF